MSDLRSIMDTIYAKPPAEQPGAVRDAVSKLSSDQKDTLAHELGTRIPDPDPATSNTIWLIIIWAFSIVMVGAVAVLSFSVFVAPPTGGTKPEIILAVFTTVTAFLAGLFAPSPVSKKSGG